MTHKKKTMYITTPIYYVNGTPHIGHAYTAVVAGFFKKFYEQRGQATYLLSGTDEHGQKVAQSAEAAGVEPLTWCDKHSRLFKEMCEYLLVDTDDFIRTTEERHKSFVQNVWKELEARGWLYKGTYNGWYSVRDEAFYGEDEIVDGKAPTGAPVEWREEESYFFKLSAFTEPLLAWFETKPDFVFPQGRYNEIKAFVRGGLRDLSVSRSSFSWGIPIPETDHVMYVWLDALFNYQSALDTSEKFQTFWNGDKIVHLVGKDILRFHAVYWPAFLSALECTPETLSTGVLEKACRAMQVVAHGWWLSEGEKMSKSLGNTVDPKDLVEKYGADYVRYYFLREPSFGGDGNFTQEGFALRINGELINNIGNLCQRTFALTHKNCDSMIPDAQVSHPLTETPLLDQVTPLVDEFKLNQAIEVILNYASKANEYVQESKPWALFKNGEEQKGRESLYVLLHAIYMIKEALYPILPEFHERLSSVFGNQTFRTGLQLNSLAKVFEQVEV